MKKYLYLFVLVTIFSSTHPVSASQFNEEADTSQTFTVNGLEFNLLDESEEEPLDSYDCVDLSSFNDAIGPRMEDLKDLDQNAGLLIGRCAKQAVEQRFGRVGGCITSATGFVAGLFGKETLTQLAIDTVRSPFKIEGDYPENPAQLVGVKLQKGISIVPYGDKVVLVASFLAAKKGKKTMTEVIYEKITKKDQEPENKE